MEFIDDSGWYDHPDDEKEVRDYHGLSAVVILGGIGGLDSNAPGKSAFRNNAEGDLRALVRRARQVEAEAKLLPPEDRGKKLQEALPPDDMGELYGVSSVGENRLSLTEEILDFLAPFWGDFTLNVDLPTVRSHRRKEPNGNIQEALHEGWKAYLKKEEAWNKEVANNASSYRSVGTRAVEDSFEVEWTFYLDSLEEGFSEREAYLQAKKDGMEFRRWVSAEAEAHIRFRMSWYYQDEKQVRRVSGQMGVKRPLRKRYVEPPVPFVFEAPVVIEDEGVQVDSTYTRCEVEDLNYLDWWEATQVEEYPRASRADDSLKEYRERSAQARAERFLVWLDYIGQTSEDTVSRVFHRDSENPEASGKFYRTLQAENGKRTREDPWLTSAQAFMLSCAARMKGGFFLSRKQKEVLDKMKHDPMNARTMMVWDMMGYK